MMHSLYMNASSFITTPAQLEAVVDRVFDDTDQFTTDTAKGENIWNLGYPETVQNLLNNMKGSDGGKVVNRVERSALLTRERMDRIAEELTGGKLRKN